VTVNTENLGIVILVDIGVAVAGVLMSIGRGKRSGMDMDRDTILFLVKMWAGIALFGIAIYFVM
jgi:hypothetical protein